MTILPPFLLTLISFQTQKIFKNTYGFIYITTLNDDQMFFTYNPR